MLRSFIAFFLYYRNLNFSQSFCLSVGHGYDEQTLAGTIVLGESEESDGTPRLNLFVEVKFYLSSAFNTFSSS